MAVDSIDKIIAGAKPPLHWRKTGITMKSAGVGHSFFYSNGNPGPGVAPSPGINGAAITGALAGCIPRSNPVSGEARLARLWASQQSGGTLLLCDRLWHNSGLSVTSTSAQAITPAAIPARDANGLSDGTDVMAAIEWSGTGGAGTPTVTLTFTDQGGTTGRTASFVANATCPIGTFEIFNFLQSGVSGIRAPTSFIQSATRTSGTMHLILFRVIAAVQLGISSVGVNMDPFELGLPRLYDDSNLFFVEIPGTTTAQLPYGQLSEAHG